MPGYRLLSHNIHQGNSLPQSTRLCTIDSVHVWKSIAPSTPHSCGWSCYPLLLQHFYVLLGVIPLGLWATFINLTHGLYPELSVLSRVNSHSPFVVLCHLQESQNCARFLKAMSPSTGNTTEWVNASIWVFFLLCGCWLLKCLNLAAPDLSETSQVVPLLSGADIRNETAPCQGRSWCCQNDVRLLLILSSLCANIPAFTCTDWVVYSLGRSRVGEFCVFANCQWPRKYVYIICF